MCPETPCAFGKRVEAAKRITLWPYFESAACSRLQCATLCVLLTISPRGSAETAVSEDLVTPLFNIKGLPSRVLRH